MKKRRAADMALRFAPSAVSGANVDMILDPVDAEHIPSVELGHVAFEVRSHQAGQCHCPVFHGDPNLAWIDERILLER